MTVTADGHGRSVGLDRLPPQIDPHAVASSSLLDVSNAMVRLYKQVFGRGPTHARTRFAGADTLVVLLHNTMTASERRLAALGEHERLSEHRALLRQTMEDDLRALVGRILGRRTVSLIGGIDTVQDVAAEIFLLAPEAALDANPGVTKRGAPDLPPAPLARSDGRGLVPPG